MFPRLFHAWAGSIVDDKLLIASWISRQWATVFTVIFHCLHCSPDERIMMIIMTMNQWR